MLLQYGDQEREALCGRCHRRSPLLRGDERPALERLEELGWATESGGAWCCPICRNRRSGEYLTTSR